MGSGRADPNFLNQTGQARRAVPKTISYFASNPSQKISHHIELSVLVQL